MQTFQGHHLQCGGPYVQRKQLSILTQADLLPAQGLAWPGSLSAEVLSVSYPHWLLGG